MRVHKVVKDKDSAASLWGKRVHEALNNYYTKDTPLPETIVQFQPIVDKIKGRAGKRYGEQQMALDSEFRPSSWFAKTTWVRGIMDVGLKTEDGSRMFIGDYKTGNYKPENTQLKLFAAMGFAHFPTVERITTAFLWLKTKQTTSESYTREQIPELWGEFLPRVRRIEIALEQDRWPPKPSGLCKAWCIVGRDRCEHCGS
jgi:hypothetical protein